jgi:hypothetical protein
MEFARCLPGTVASDREESMNKRPLSVTVIAWLYLIMGVVGLAYHATELKIARPLENDAVWVCFVRLLAIIAGAFMLRGRNWARWLAVAWMAWHVYLSAFHPLSELIMHSVLLVVFALFLFRPPASVWFRAAKTNAPSTTDS